jgi:putative Mg2+ transporter-C (MgtC) family protein
VWDTMMDEFGFSSSLPLGVIMARMLGAALFCGLIGFEREASQRPAGLRTHTLIGTAACVYALLSLALLDRASDFPDHVSMDPLRLIDSVTSGVAFLAAGLIVFAKGKVRGLTTGASMWLAAAIGLACGLGEWTIAVLTTALALVVIVVLRWLERRAGTYEDRGH